MRLGLANMVGTSMNLTSISVSDGCFTHMHRTEAIMPTRPICYMCDCASTSKEHVPPRCLFPESKDLDGDFRKDLITVPSCDLHNSGKSTDDEFLLVCLAGIIGNNSIGLSHKFTKVNRAIRRSAFKLLEQSMTQRRIEWVEIGQNQFIDVIWGTPNYDRLNACFDRIARGLHLHHFDRRFSGTTRVLLGYTQNHMPNPAEFQRLIREKAASELAGKPRLGSNPDVFTFQFTDADQYGIFSLHLQFYSGLDVFIGMMPEECEIPRNFAMELIELGIPTVIMESGRMYRFNSDEDGTAQAGLNNSPDSA